MKYCQECLNFTKVPEESSCMICGSQNMKDIIIEVHHQKNV